MSARDVRYPPCHRCGIVEGIGQPRHKCDPVGLISMKHGMDAAIEIGRAAVAFLTMRAAG